MREVRFTTEMEGRGLFDVSFIGIDPSNDWDFKEMTEELEMNFLSGQKDVMLPMCLTASYYKNGESIVIFDLLSYKDGVGRTPSVVVYSYQTTAG